MNSVKLFTIITLIIAGLLAGCQNKPTKSNFDSSGTEFGFEPPPVWSGSMQNLKRHLVNLEPYIFDKEKFNAVESEAVLIKEIHGLAVESSYVKHDPAIATKDPTVKFVASQFAEELQQADQNFKGGWKDYSRSQLMKVTSYCVECHTRLRQGPEFQTDSKSNYVSTLSRRNQIELFIAFREFDKAFSLSLESVRPESTFIQKESDIYAVARLGLQVAVQFQQNITKTGLLLSTIDKNKSIPRYLKLANDRWKISIQHWNPDTNLRSLSEIRELIKNRHSEIDDMRAIAALLTYLTSPIQEQELGEALLLTGESYERLNGVSTLALQDNYYEACVRKAPKTKWGKKCFNNLENSVRSSYSGLSKIGLPQDVKKKLDQLKKQLE
ncbi:MAG: hypothetical protein H7256_13675 [Bdellovibrio sp.]|nr:hypothetical protein [Bdellovibrio sp.]